MANIKVVLDKRRMRNDGTYPIRFYVYHRGPFFISTNFTSSLEDWNEHTNMYSDSIRGAKAKNMTLRAQVAKLEKDINDLEFTNQLARLSKDQLKDLLSFTLTGRKKNREKVFVDYIDDYINSKLDNSGTCELYERTKQKIEAFDANCTFDTINKAWLDKFTKFLAATLKVNSYAIHLRNIRAVFNYAIDYEITTCYPFRKYQIKKEETRKKALTIEEIKILRDYPVEKHQQKYRDIFMLMFYMVGINIGDILKAKPSDIVNGRLEYRRTKTGKLFSVLIQPEAQEIIDRYKGVDYLINVLDTFVDYRNFNHRLGIELKRMGEVERVGRGGKKERKPRFESLSYNCARQSWATMASQLDVPQETIAADLGHSSNSVTDIYIKFNIKEVDEANREVLDSLLVHPEEEGDEIAKF